MNELDRRIHRWFGIGLAEPIDQATARNHRNKGLLRAQGVIEASRLTP